MLRHKYKVMISGSTFGLYQEGANQILTFNTLITIEQLAHISVRRTNKSCCNNVKRRL